MTKTLEEIARLRSENAALRNIVRDFHWMARRYADGRSSYAPGIFNRHVRALVGLDFEFASNAPLFARDGMGREFDGLTEQDRKAAELDMPKGHAQHAVETEERTTTAIREAEKRGAEKEREVSTQQIASLDAAVVDYVRSAAKRVYGESCSFVIDDIDRLAGDANAYRSASPHSEDIPISTPDED
jgi:hypothetical protein